MFFPRTLQKTLDLAITDQIAAVRPVIKDAVVFLFELVAVEIIEEQVSPQIVGFSLERDNFGLRLRTRLLGRGLDDSVGLIDGLSLFQDSENALAEFFQIERRVLPVVEIAMILGRDLQIANPALERLPVQMIRFGGPADFYLRWSQDSSRGAQIARRLVGEDLGELAGLRV